MAEAISWRIGSVLGVRNVKKVVDYYADVLGFECPGGIIAVRGERMRWAWEDRIG